MNTSILSTVFLNQGTLTESQVIDRNTFTELTATISAKSATNQYIRDSYKVKKLGKVVYVVESWRPL